MLPALHQVSLNVLVLPTHPLTYARRQDYLYLKYYARANGCALSSPLRRPGSMSSLTTRSLLVAKSSTYGSMQSATQTTLNIITEVSTHTSLATQWDIPKAELGTTPETPPTTTYGAYLLDVGLQGPSLLPPNPS